MPDITPIIPALVPLAALLWIRAADHSVSISTNHWLQEYDYIVGECELCIKSFAEALKSALVSALCAFRDYS